MESFVFLFSDFGFCFGYCEVLKSYLNVYNII